MSYEASSERSEMKETKEEEVTMYERCTGNKIQGKETMQKSMFLKLL